MSIKEIRNSLPDYAKDMKINLGTILSEEGSPDLTLTQIYGTALASAYAIKNQRIVDATLSDAQDHLTEADINGAKAAATVMAMNNIYYRFIHLASNKEYGKLPAGLRMNILRDPGIAKVDFELYSLAVSAINGCGLCIDSHEKTLTREGVSQQAVQSAIRIASVLHAVAQTLSIES